MSNTAILVNTAVAVVAIVILIVKLRFNPVVALVLGAAYLGLATGLGATATAETVATGFGEIMAEIGLLVGFGVLMGAILRELGAIQRLVESLLRVFGPRGIPYALSLTIATFLQSIYLDVLLVISAPLARRVARRLGTHGTARMATAMAVGLECGIVFTVPGVGALALAGLLDVPLGRYLVFGLIVVVPTVAATIAVMSLLLTRGWWNPEVDEDHTAFADERTDPPIAGQDDQSRGSAGAATPPPTSGPGSISATVAAGAPSGGTSTATTTRSPAAARSSRSDQTPLLVLFGPLLISLVLIAVGALCAAFDWAVPVVDFISAPVIALLIGLIGTCFVGRYAVGQPAVEAAIAKGLSESGQILLLNGVGGSLAAMIAAVGMGDILGEYFSASTVAPLLVVWVVAAVLHVAVGSVTISAITSAGLLAPVAASIGLDPVLIALAAGAGSLFVVHLTSNTFWLLQSLLGQTTRGTLKTCTVGVSLASVIAMGPILALSVVL